MSARARRRALLAGLAGAALAGPLACAQAASPAASGEVLPWPRLRLLDGGSLDRATLGERALVLVFFSTSCPYCQRHNQHVEKLARATHGQALQVLGVAQDSDPAAVREYLGRHGLSFPVTLDAEPLRSLLTRRRVIPLTCVLDRSGRLREVIPGEMFEDDVLGLARWASAA